MRRVAAVLVVILGALGLADSGAGAQQATPMQCTVRAMEPTGFGVGSRFDVVWSPSFEGDVDRYVIQRRAFSDYFWRGRTDAATTRFIDEAMPRNASSVRYRVLAKAADGTVVEESGCVLGSTVRDCSVEQTPAGFDLRFELANSAFGGTVIRRQVSDGGPFYWRARTGDEVEFQDGPSPNDRPVIYQTISVNDGLIVGASVCTVAVPACEAELTPFRGRLNQDGALIGDLVYQAGGRQGSPPGPPQVDILNMRDRSLRTLVEIAGDEAPRNFVSLRGKVYYLAEDPAAGAVDNNLALFELDPAAPEPRRLGEFTARDLAASSQALYLGAGGANNASLLRFDPDTLASVDILPAGFSNGFQGSTTGFFYYTTLEIVAGGPNIYTGWAYNETTNRSKVFRENGLSLVFRGIVEIDGIVYYRTEDSGPELWRLNPITGESTAVRDLAIGPQAAFIPGTRTDTSVIQDRLAITGFIAELGGNGLFTWDPATNVLRREADTFVKYLEWNGKTWGRTADGSVAAIRLCP